MLVPLTISWRSQYLRSHAYFTEYDVIPQVNPCRYGRLALLTIFIFRTFR